MATQFQGSPGAANFGLTLQSGILLESVNHNFQHDKKMIADADGDMVAKTLYNERLEGNMSGYNLATGYSGTIAAAITLATTPESFLKAGAPAGLCLVESISMTYSNTDYEKIDLSFEQYAGITG